MSPLAVYGAALSASTSFATTTTAYSTSIAVSESASTLQTFTETALLPTTPSITVSSAAATAPSSMLTYASLLESLPIEQPTHEIRDSRRFPPGTQHGAETFDTKHPRAVADDLATEQVTASSTLRQNAAPTTLLTLATPSQSQAQDADFIKHGDKRPSFEIHQYGAGRELMSHHFQPSQGQTGSDKDLHIKNKGESSEDNDSGNLDKGMKSKHEDSDTKNKGHGEDDVMGSEHAGHAGDDDDDDDLDSNKDYAKRLAVLPADDDAHFTFGGEAHKLPNKASSHSKRWFGTEPCGQSFPGERELYGTCNGVPA